MNNHDMLDIIGEARSNYVMDAQACREGKKQSQRRSTKKILIFTLAATLILGTMTGAAVFTRWSKSMEAEYMASQEQKELAEDLGLSSMLEKEEKPETPISDTDQGITITAVQTIVDSYRARITYRIDGYDLPEGKNPAIWGGIQTIGGQPLHEIRHGRSGEFYDGTVRDENGNRVYEDGTPLQYDDDEFHSTILRFQNKDGSLEYTEYIGFVEPGKHLGKMVEANFSALGYQTGKVENAEDVKGNWDLKWTLTGTDKSYTAKPDAPIGDTGHTLQECEVTPLTVRVKLTTKDYFSGWEILDQFPNGLVGVRMKDGTVNQSLQTRTEGYEDPDSLTAVLEAEAKQILDVDQVQSILFYKDCKWDESGRMTDLTYYEVPIR